MNDEDEKFYIESLGLDIRLRPYSFNDYFRLSEDEDEPLTEKGRVKKILHDHIISPPVEFENFEEISDTDLECLGSEFLNKNFDSELEIFDGEDFAHFFLKVINDEENRVAESREKINAYLIKSNQELINDVRKTFEPLFKSSIFSLQPQINILSDSIANISRSILLPYLGIQDSLESISKSISSINQLLIESLQNQFDSFANWFEIHDGIFAPFRKYWLSFEEEYRITEEKAVEVLRKYHWLISPSMPLSLLYKIVKIDKKGGKHTRAKINHLFYDYFEQNNRINLLQMIEGWVNIPLFKGRKFKIISDCVEVIILCDSNNTNAANVIVPTLIAQIDGIMSEYSEMNGLYCKKTKWYNIETAQRINREDFIKENKSQIMPSLLDELATEITLDILFQNAFRGKAPEKGILFSRHKIMHGENLSYGRRDYMIKAFLILDFLAHIIDAT